MTLLSYDRMGEGPPLLFLHGLFGSKDNWKAIAHAFADRYTCVLVDLRNHGHSFFDDTHSYQDQAEDVCCLLTHLNLKKPIIIGHSMGGKVALTCESLFQCSKSVVLMDILPVAYNDHHSFIFDALEKVDLSVCHTYSQLRDAFSSVLSDPMLVQFFLKSVKKKGDTFSWALNLPVLHDYYTSIRGVPPIQTITAPVHCIYGERSSYVSESKKNESSSYFTSISYTPIPNAGHWVHVDNRLAVIDALLAWVTKI